MRTVAVKVVYALPDRQVLTELTVPVGSTVRDVVACSGLLERFPEIDLETNRVGVYSRLVELDAVVNDGDRVEIYRPLTADPKSARRRRAREKRATGRAGRG